MTIKPKILVVDDNAENRDLIMSIFRRLKGMDVETIEAKNGQQAIELAREHRPDLVLLDIQMPDVSGYDVCTAIKQNADLKDTYIIMVTAQAERADKQQAEQVGADDYVVKPYDIQMLRSKVEKVLTERLSEDAAPVTPAAPAQAATPAPSTLPDPGSSPDTLPMKAAEKPAQPTAKPPDEPKTT